MLWNYFSRYWRRWWINTSLVSYNSLSMWDYCYNRCYKDAFCILNKPHNYICLQLPGNKDRCMCVFFFVFFYEIISDMMKTHSSPVFLITYLIITPLCHFVLYFFFLTLMSLCNLIDLPNTHQIHQTRPKPNLESHFESRRLFLCFITVTGLNMFSEQKYEIYFLSTRILK